MNQCHDMVSMPTILPISQDDDQITRVVRQLNCICRAATLDFALSIGELIIDSFYAGNLDLWRNRDKTKEVSLRKLAKHPDLPMGAAALYRSIAIYEISVRLRIRSRKHISTSHVRLVLPLAAQDQARLLNLAEDNRWPVRRLDAEVAKLSSKATRRAVNRGGRRRDNFLAATMKVLHRCVESLREVLARPQASFAELSPESVRAILDSLQCISKECANLESRLSHTLVAPRKELTPNQ